MPIVLILMVKNEGRILKRCLDSAMDFVDACFILDTGSTDTTCDIISDIISSDIYKKPVKLASTVFQTFGKTRSESFILAKEFITKDCMWKPQESYGLLLDADMVLKAVDFDMANLTKYDEYKIIQRQGGIEYHNTRLIRMSLDWKCIGSTHEFWTFGDKTGRVSDGTTVGIFNNMKRIWIDDISDGGCKSDKLERDEKLLKNDLDECVKENNLFSKQRTLYYLAQTYKCMRDYPKAIEIYLQRADCGGWDEELWSSYYNIASLYLEGGNKEKSIEYALKAYDTDTTRAEPLYLLTRIYIIKEDRDLALKYVNMGISIKKNTTKLLSSEMNVYTYEFYVLKFIILINIPNTQVNELLFIGINMINRAPKDHQVVQIFASLIHTLSITIDCDKIDTITDEEYDEVVAEPFGLGTIMYNKHRSIAYSPIVLDGNYSCIGVSKDGIIMKHNTNSTVHKYITLLDKFKIINFD